MNTMQQTLNAQCREKTLSKATMQQLAAKGILVLDRQVKPGGRWGYTPVVAFTLVIGGEPRTCSFEDVLDRAWMRSE